MIKTVFIFLVMIALQGCGSIMIGKHAPITIKGTASSEMKYFIYNNQGQLVASGYAPDKVRFNSSFSKQDKEYRVVLKAKDQPPQLYKIKRGINEWIFLFPIFTIIDILNDALFRFPEVELE